eukprot:symbB.v1.2.038598.t1/scaffold6040.1/size29092/1
MAPPTEKQRHLKGQGDCSTLPLRFRFDAKWFATLRLFAWMDSSRNVSACKSWQRHPCSFGPLWIVSHALTGASSKSLLMEQLHPAIQFLRFLKSLTPPGPKTAFDACHGSFISLWDAHDSEERGYLDRKELEDLLGHLRQKLGGSGDLSPEAVKRCAEELHFDEESGELRQEVFGRRFQQFWAKKEELLELFQPKAMIVEGDGDMAGDAAGYVAGDAASGAAVTSWLTSNIFSIDDALCFPEGTACWVRDALVMTEKEDLKSAIIKDVPGPSEGHPSIRLFVVECGRQDASRLCVKDASGDVGWVSVKSKDGRPLLRPVSSWLTMAEPQHDKDAVHREVLRIWQQHRHAQEQGADLASELLAAHHQALTQDARNWCQEQERHLEQRQWWVRIGLNLLRRERPVCGKSSGSKSIN